MLECVGDPGVDECTLWKELPATWSAPVPGQACKMTELMQSDPEFLKIQRTVYKAAEDGSGSRWLLGWFCSPREPEIISVSESFQLLCVVVVVTACNKSSIQTHFVTIVW